MPCTCPSRVIMLRPVRRSQTLPAAWGKWPQRGLLTDCKLDADKQGCAQCAGRTPQLHCGDACPSRTTGGPPASAGRAAPAGQTASLHSGAAGARQGFGRVQQLAGVRPTAFMQDGAAGPERAYQVASSHCTSLSTVLIDIRMLQALSKHCTQQKWQLSSLQPKPRPPPTSLISICYIKCNADSCPTSTEPTQKDQV